jgi:hypothetical protein
MTDYLWNCANIAQDSAPTWVDAATGLSVIDAGRTGKCLQFFGATLSTVPFRAISAQGRARSGSVRAGFALKYGSATTVVNSALAVFPTANPDIALGLTQTGQIRVRDTAQLLIWGTSTNTLTLNKWHYIEVYFKPGGKDVGQAIVRVDGTEWVNAKNPYGGAAPLTGTHTSTEVLRFTKLAGATTWIDDVYMFWDGTGSTWAGPQQVPEDKSEAKTWNGSAWVAMDPIQMWNGTRWRSDAKAWNGTRWVPLNG